MIEKKNIKYDTSLKITTLQVKMYTWLNKFTTKRTNLSIKDYRKLHTTNFFQNHASDVHIYVRECNLYI